MQQFRKEMVLMALAAGMAVSALTGGCATGACDQAMPSEVLAGVDEGQLEPADPSEEPSRSGGASIWDVGSILLFILKAIV
ncbi:MAG: hypothetical protein KIT54_00530 [Phycisphaeraceae bacterium]|nr:hypothetical protein [Phycisphaeraceae bacterium]